MIIIIIIIITTTTIISPLLLLLSLLLLLQLLLFVVVIIIIIYRAYNTSDCAIYSHRFKPEGNSARFFGDAFFSLIRDREATTKGPKKKKKKKRKKERKKSKRKATRVETRCLSLQRDNCVSSQSGNSLQYV